MEKKNRNGSTKPHMSCSSSVTANSVSNLCPGLKRTPHARKLYTTNLDRFRKTSDFRRAILNIDEQNASNMLNVFLTLGIGFHRNLTQNCMLRGIEHGILPVNLGISMERQVKD